MTNNFGEGDRNGPSARRGEQRDARNRYELNEVFFEICSLPVVVTRRRDGGIPGQWDHLYWDWWGIDQDRRPLR